MFKLRNVLFVIVIAGFSAAYAKSKLITSWQNPEIKAGHFKRVLVVGMSANPGRRSDFEDDLAASLSRPGMTVIAGHEILLRPEGSKPNLDYIRMQIKEKHIDAVVLSRLVSVKESVTYIPPSVTAWGAYPYYRSFYGYYGAVYPVVYDPGYLSVDVKVRVETNVYAIVPPDGELVWTGTSDTFNPKDAHKVIKDVVKLVTGELTKDGII